MATIVPMAAPKIPSVMVKSQVRTKLMTTPERTKRGCLLVTVGLEQDPSNPFIVWNGRIKETPPRPERHREGRANSRGMIMVAPTPLAKQRESLIPEGVRANRGTNQVGMALVMHALDNRGR